MGNIIHAAYSTRKVEFINSLAELENAANMLCMAVGTAIQILDDGGSSVDASELLRSLRYRNDRLHRVLYGANDE